MTTGLVFVLILFTAVMVHELAHYANALSVGVPVRAFSVGFGPVLWRRSWRGTEWRLSAIPLGGYVDLPGMTAERGDDGTLRAPSEGLAAKGLAAKLWVLVGGVIANFVLGTLLLTVAVLLQPGYRALTTGVAPSVSGTEVVQVVHDSLAQQVGLQVGDRLLAVNDLRDPVPDAVAEEIGSTAGPLRIVMLRDGVETSLEIPWPPSDLSPGERPLLGVQLGPAEVAPVPVGTALVESAAFAVRAVPEMVAGFLRGFGSALSGRSSEEVAGPVGMVGLVSDATRMGVAPVLVLAAIINFSLAVFNLLPIPGLDGGRILLATVAALRGRPFKPGQEEALHFFGILAVLTLIVLITLQEVQSFVAPG
jgi:regulator of sigma E protease